MRQFESFIGPMRYFVASLIPGIQEARIRTDERDKEDSCHERRVMSEGE